MLRKLLLALVLILVAPASFAQNSTTVTINVTDAGGQTWNNGTYTLTFVGPGTATWPGGAIQQVFTGALSGSGSASVSLPSNAVIIPSPTFWNVKVCPNPSVTYGPSGCFTQNNNNIFGSTQTLTLTPPAIVITVPTIATAISPVVAYADAEISGGWVGFAYYNVATGQRQCTAMPCSSNFAAAGGGGGTGAGTALASVFNISTNCNGVTNCLQWVDDDVTDNCGTATTNFVALINAYAGNGVPQVVIGGSGAGKAYLLQTCHMKFTVARGITIHSYATIDAGTNSLANLFEFSNQGINRWVGGTFIGGASLTVAGLEFDAATGDDQVSEVNAFNFGAGNATLGNCTNYFLQFDANIAEGTVRHVTWANSDSTTGRCFANNPATNNSTIMWIDNVVGGNSGSICASQGIVDGGFLGTMSHNNIGNIAIPIRIQGSGHRLEHNQLDTEGCVAKGVSAVIHFGGNGSSANIDSVEISDNVAQFGSGHPTNFIQRAGDSTATISNWQLIGNSPAGGSPSSNQPVIAGNPACGVSTVGSTPYPGCYEYANSGFIPIIACGSTNQGWILVNILAQCAASTAGANIGSTTLYNAPAAAGTLTFIGAYLTCRVQITTAATTSSTLPQCVITYTDSVTSVVQTITVTPVWASGTIGCSGTTTNTLGNSCQASVGPLFIKAGTTVTYSTINWASTGATAMVAQVIPTLFLD